MADVSVKRGDKTTLFFGPVVNESGATQSLTGWTGTLSARRKRTDASPLLISRAISVTDAPGGLFQVVIEPADTNQFAGDATLEYDVELRDPADAPRTVADGQFIVESDVTRA